MRVVQIKRKPVYHREAYTLAVQKEVLDYFFDVIFLPIIQLCDEAGLGVETRENALGAAVLRALQSGKIWYTDENFSGQFSAAISRELRAMGATFDKSLKVFHLQQQFLPPEIRNACYASKARAESLHKSIIRTLTEVEGNIPKAPVGLNLNSAVDKITADLQKQFIATLSGITGIEVPAEVTPSTRKALTTDLTNNLELYIKKFALDEIPKLRAEVEENAFAGYRVDRLAQIIEARYGVTKRKAKFLAGQETRLLTSKLREQRYRESGIRSYEWSTSHDERVRPDHAVLNEETFSFDTPPITDRATGARNNPGEDYNCRCVPIPIIGIEVLK